MAGRTCRDPDHLGYRAFAAVQMIDPADRLVHALKFHDRPEVGALMALFMAQRLRREDARRWDVLVPAPLHATRERARGYNQSAEIARRLSRSPGGRVLHGALERVRATRPQADLDHEARSANVAGAFRLVLPTRGLRCLLVDDVATTGHTLVAALEALKEGGPEATGAVVFALA
jgi:ComF family protein